MGGNWVDCEMTAVKKKVAAAAAVVVLVVAALGIVTDSDEPVVEV